MVRTRLSFSRTHKIIAAVLAGLLLASVLMISWAGSKAADFVKEKVASQTFLQGNLRIGDVGASLSGDVWIKDVTWHDPAGTLIAKIPRLNISVRFSDILSASLGAGSIETIVLERPELHLVYSEKDGINVVKLVNLDDRRSAAEKEADKSKEPTKFRGDLEIDKGTLEIISGKNTLKYESLDSKITYKDYPKVTGTMQAKQNKADFAGKLEMLTEKDSSNIKLEIEGRSIALVDFFNMVPVKSNWKVLEGTLPSLKARAEIIGKNPLKLEAEGNVEGLKAETEGLIIDGVKGNFKGNQEEINLIAFTGNLNGQPIKVDGKVITSSDPYKVNINAASDSFKLDALSPGMAINSPLSFNANITGASDNPVATGSFSIPSLKTEQLEISNARGDFTYAGGVLRLMNASGGVYQGVVNAVGSVKLSDKSFVFDLVGSGINSTAMTETKIRGPLSFNAHVTGVGDPNAAAANGRFEIGRGDFAGIPFNLMRGNFSKLGSNMSFSNIEVHTLLGVVKTTGGLDANGRIRFDMIDVNNISKNSIVDNVAGSIKKEQDKVTSAIKKLF